jgi:hypothetical protein
LHLDAALRLSPARGVFLFLRPYFTPCCLELIATQRFVAVMALPSANVSLSGLICLRGAAYLPEVRSALRTALTWAVKSSAWD